MAYYGQRPSGQQLQQAAGGNPFYNPYSAYPNIGMGISSILQNVMAQKQFTEQQTYERGVQEREMGQRDRQLDIQEQPTIRATPEWQFKINAYKAANPITDGHPTNDYEAIKGVKKAETIDKKSGTQEQIDALVAIGMKEKQATRRVILGDKKKPTEKVPRESLQRGRDKELIGKLESGVKGLQSSGGTTYTSPEGGILSMLGKEKDTPFAEEIATSVANVRNALTEGELSAQDRRRAQFLNTLIAAGGPSEKEVNEINKLAAKYNVSPDEVFDVWVDFKAHIK